MRWRGRNSSNNVEDRRDLNISGGAGGAGGLLRFLPLVFRFLGLKGTLILVALVGGYGFFTGNFQGLLSSLGLQQGGQVTQTRTPVRETAEEKEQVKFVSVILADTELTWSKLLSQKGITYKKPKLVLFRHRVKSACGIAQSATGPFYCPADQKVYLDLSFFDELRSRFRAPGDFAQAYVIAHEIGHHVQTLLGISEKVHAARSRMNKVDSNKLSVLQELQADCFAGVWAHQANSYRNLLESGDIEEGLRAATAIGDDTLQKQSQGYVTPDSFTHGTSQQRVYWFKRGYTSGKIESCNTFKSQG